MCDPVQEWQSYDIEFVLEAAAVDQDCEKKVELLVRYGLPVDGVNCRGMSLLHLGAMASSLRILELATPGYQICTNVHDSLHNTPLHYLNANERLQDYETISHCVKFLISRDENMMEMLNSKGDSPLFSALAASRKQVVCALLNAGAAVPSLKMTKRLKFEHVSVLAEDDVIVQSKRPLITALQVAGQMGRLAESKLDVEKYLEISGRLEKFAIAMTNSQNSSLTELSTEVLFAAVENKQKEVTC